MYKRWVSSLTSKIWSSSSSNHQNNDTTNTTTNANSTESQSLTEGRHIHVKVNTNEQSQLQSPATGSASGSGSGSALSLTATAVSISSFFSPEVSKRKRSRSSSRHHPTRSGNVSGPGNTTGNTNANGKVLTPTLSSPHGSFRFDVNVNVNNNVNPNNPNTSASASADNNNSDNDNDSDERMMIRNNSNSNSNSRKRRKIGVSKVPYFDQTVTVTAASAASASPLAKQRSMDDKYDSDEEERVAALESCDDGDISMSMFMNESESTLCIDTTDTSNDSNDSYSLLLEQIPHDVIQTHIACYLTKASDHYALSLTCRKLHEMSNTTHCLKNVSLWEDKDDGENDRENGDSNENENSSNKKNGGKKGKKRDRNEDRTNSNSNSDHDGDSEDDDDDADTTAATVGTGNGNNGNARNANNTTRTTNNNNNGRRNIILKQKGRCILNNIDVPEIAIEKLYKYAVAGNRQGLYMIGMIAAYCYGDKVGVTILRQNAKRGCLRSSYTLSLILRDCNKEEADAYLRKAVEVDYLPACQELLSSQEVKDRFGDLDYKSLQRFFDPIALNRLLGRTYLQSSGVRGVSTSHCWNPNCGRWALKATTANNRGGNNGGGGGANGPQLQFSSKYLPPLPPHLEACLLKLVEDFNQEEQFGNGLGGVGGSSSTSSRRLRRRNAANSFVSEGGVCMEVNSGMMATCPHYDSSSIATDTTATATDAANFLSTNRVPRSPSERSFRVSRMKMCSSCRRAKYCSKLCQVYDWRSGQHKMECQYLWTG